MIIAKSSDACDDWQYDDSKQNYLLSLLDDTVYSDEKKQDYESMIKSELNEQEYNSLRTRFWDDSIDDVTMRGTYGMAALHNHLKKLR